jgi:hypothetical protein
MATVPEARELLLRVLLAAGAFACAAAAGAASGSSSKVPAIYVFGDSTADVGNNNYLPGSAVPRANFPHNGVDFPTARPTGRFSNGYNGVDFLGKHSVIAARLAHLCSQLGPKVESCVEPWRRIWREQHSWLAACMHATLPSSFSPPWFFPHYPTSAPKVLDGARVCSEDLLL